MATQPTAEEIQAEVQIFWKVVESLPQERQQTIGRMMKEIGESYVTAPASSRTEYHGCYPGGLLVHSLDVTKVLRKLAKLLAPGKFSDDSLAMVGLFHDLGKATDGGDNEVYLPNPSQWHREKLGALYEVNKDIVHMTVADRSIFVLQKFGVELSNEEFLAIRLADAQNVRENEAYRYKEPDLALLLQFANGWSERQQKAAV